MRALVLLVALVVACEPKPAEVPTTPEPTNMPAMDAGPTGSSAACANLEARLHCGPQMFPGQTCSAAFKHLAESGMPYDHLAVCWARASSCQQALGCSQ